MEPEQDISIKKGPPWPVEAVPTPVLKRVMDLTGAMAIGVATTPLCLFAYMLTRVLLGKPVFFKQWRGGHGGTKFQIIKFRTMTDDRDDQGQLLPDADRAHWWGNFMRRASIDELPGLLNIVKGDMSLVGPRPLYAVYLDRFSEHHAQRHQVKPGLTGLSQTRGRNSLTWEERFELDLKYVADQSLLLDIRILWDTVRAVFGGGADGAKLTTIYAGDDGSQTHGQE